MLLMQQRQISALEEKLESSEAARLSEIAKLNKIHKTDIAKCTQGLQEDLNSEKNNLEMLKSEFEENTANFRDKINGLESEHFNQISALKQKLSVLEEQLKIERRKNSLLEKNKNNKSNIGSMLKNDPSVEKSRFQSQTYSIEEFDLEFDEDSIEYEVIDDESADKNCEKNVSHQNTEHKLFDSESSTSGAEEGEVCGVVANSERRETTSVQIPVASKIISKNVKKSNHLEKVRIHGLIAAQLKSFKQSIDSLKNELSVKSQNEELMLLDIKRLRDELEYHRRFIEL